MKQIVRGWLLLAVAVMLVLGGCSGKHKMVAGAPDWVNEGSGAFDIDDNELFYGVGAVQNVSSVTLAMQTADERARADVARQIATFVKSLFKDYQASTSASTSDRSFEEQHVEATLENLAEVTVRGARIIDHWKDPETKTLFALARLDLEGVKATLSQMDHMDPALRDYVRENANRAFQKIKK